MKTFIPKGVDAIATDDEFANLENYSRRRGIFTYMFRVRIDQIRVLKLNATRLRITLKHDEKKKKKSTFGQGALSPKAAINALLVDRPSKKDDIRNRKKDIIQQRKMDVSARVDNDVARYVHQFSEEDAMTLLPMIRTYEFKTVAELRAARSETSYNNISFREEDYADVDGLDISSMSYEAVNKLGRDPASVIMSREKIVTQDDALFGTIPANKTEEDKFSNKVIKTLRRDLTITSNAKSLDELSDEDLIPVRVKRYKKYVTIKKRFLLRRKQLKNRNSFNVILELLDREGAIVQRETVRVDHRKLLQDYFIPRKSPMIRYTSSRVGLNVIRVTQRDKKATAIRVFKRTLNDSKPLINSPYTVVGTFNVRKRGRRRNRSTSIRIKDYGPNSNPVIYRAVPMRGKVMYPLFKSIVVPATPLPKEFVVTKNKFSTMTLMSRDEGVEIEVRKFDKNAAFMAILRRDLTANERTFRLLSKEMIGDGSAWRKINSPVMTFVDSAVKDARIYEYQVRTMYKDGTEINLIGGTFIEYMSPSDEVSFTVSKPRVTRGRKNANCTFNIAVTLENDDGNTNQSELLKDFLKTSGTEQFYLTDSQKQELRDDSRKIVVFSIERMNMTTGGRVMFNIFNPSAGSKFNDTKMSKMSNVPRLSAGNKYRYIIRAHKLSPSDLFKEAGVSKIDRRTGRTYTTRTAKLRSRKAIRSGTVLPSRSKVRSVGRNAIFNMGKTGSYRAVNADLTDTLPEVVDAAVEKISNVENVLSWSVRGDTSKIDHFIIIIEKLRSTIPIFVAQAFPGVLEYEYVDTFTPKIRGPIEFKILPVYLDYTRGDMESMGGIISTGIAGKRRRQR